MASIPGTKQGAQRPDTSKENKPADSNKPEDVQPTKAVEQAESLLFDDVEDIPQGSDLDALTNPFQDKVNELAQSGKATRFKYDAENETWALNKIRRAANNVNKGARTKVTPVEGDPTKVLIWFKVVQKTNRPRRNKA